MKKKQKREIFNKKAFIISIISAVVVIATGFITVTVVGWDNYYINGLIMYATISFAALIAVPMYLLGVILCPENQSIEIIEEDDKDGRK